MGYLIMNNRLPNAVERTIISRNAINPEEVSVVHSSTDTIVLLVYKTRDTIILSAGDKGWKNDFKKPKI